MGSEVNATCKCGLNTIIRIGGGSGGVSATVCYFPCLCANCYNLVQASLIGASPQCPECQSTKLIPYDDPSLVLSAGKSVVNVWNMWNSVIGEPVRKLELTDGKYKCPKCGNFTLFFASTGTRWD
jgi:Zn finger protein HypA/HybF involved in hydrogenase expression